MNGLLVVVLEEHIRTHLKDADATYDGDQSNARQTIIDVVHSYSK
jgi:DNA-binding FrmR family transcriptional regulator